MTCQGFLHTLGKYALIRRNVTFVYYTNVTFFIKIPDIRQPDECQVFSHGTYFATGGVDPDTAGVAGGAGVRGTSTLEASFLPPDAQI